MSVEGGVASTVAGGVAASCLAGAAAYSLLAPFIKCTVNCHFCNQNSKVFACLCCKIMQQVLR